MKTIKELKAEKGWHSNHPLDKRNCNIEILKDVLELIDELSDELGLYVVVEELITRIKG